mmetsp:Transcript_18482/g.33469  ORF Transcript_18482/g.33469 Transcript_18482/m.33469 type:complete len:200 (+) Transcript_18482:815-1414(+)
MGCRMPWAIYVSVRIVVPSLAVVVLRICLFPSRSYTAVKVQHQPTQTWVEWSRICTCRTILVIREPFHQPPMVFIRITKIRTKELLLRPCIIIIHSHKEQEQELREAEHMAPTDMPPFRTMHHTSNTQIGVVAGQGMMCITQEQEQDRPTHKNTFPFQSCRCKEVLHPLKCNMCTGITRKEKSVPLQNPMLECHKPLQL